MDNVETNVQLTAALRPNKISLMGYCIICLKKGRDVNTQVSLEKIEDKSVERTLSFLNTFNEVWKVLQSGYKGKPEQNEDDSGASSLPRVSMEAVLLEGSSSNGTFFQEPSLCQLCHVKIDVLDNLMKAVRRQVRGIQMILMESRKNGRLEEFEKVLKDNGLEENAIRSTLKIVDIFGSSSMDHQHQHNESVKMDTVTMTNKGGEHKSEDSNLGGGQIKQEEYWQESTGSMNGEEEMPSQSSTSNAVEIELSNDFVKREDNFQANNAADDCDEDDSNWSWDEDNDGESNNIKIEDENIDEDGDGDDGDDDSNWELDNNDKGPVIIKSEEMNEDEGDHDAGDNEELTSDHDQNEDAEEEEEFMTVEDQQTIPVAEKDPLEIPVSLKRKITTLTTASTSQGSSTQMAVSCDEEGCTRKFSTMSALFTHKRNYHPSPSQKLLKLQKLRKASTPLIRPQPIASSSVQKRKLYPCDLEGCTQRLLSLESLHRHKIQYHTDLMAQLGKLEPTKFQCSCGRRFQSHQARYLHMSKNQGTHPEFRPEIRKEVETQNQNCDQCGESIKLSNILEHLSSHLGGASEYVVKCPNYDQCGHMFTHSKDLQEIHLPSNSKRLGNACRKKALENKCDLICETCGFTVGRRIRLKTHVANEHERGTLPKNLNCPISGCTKMFAVKQSIYFHLHVHRKSPPVTNQLCKFCLEQVKIEEIEDHLKGKHGILEVISCEMCPYKFSERETFEKHLRDYHRHVSLSCEICGATYNDYGRLQRHQKEHQDKVTEWKCEVENCGKLFKKQNSWNHHINSFHGGKKPFVCDVCGKGFSLGARLKGHKDSVHLGLRPWGCDQCGESFGTNSILKQHKLIHTGERPFECGTCGQRFRHKEVLNRHEKGHQVKGKDFRPNGPMKKIRKRIAPRSVKK